MAGRRDVQVRVQAPEYGTAGAGNARPLPGRVPVVLKVYSMMTWLWFGLAAAPTAAGITFAYTTVLDGRRGLKVLRAA